ncbi:MAG TPA: dipeptide/oligopeptide/nickel ABC transporter ATP-binding protein [Myxococcales bacterium]|nr:dipeptide/oligopeptide/nickel ABC transporter ATP-binding protein [Myxococcales bacterium]
MTGPLLEVRDLRVDRGGRRILEGISFSLAAGETLGIIGESGSGKSTLARTLVRLLPAAGGQVLWKGADLLPLRGASLRAARREMQIVFQDPATSLDPRMQVGAIVAEPLALHRLARGRDRAAAVARLLRTVELDADLMSRHPHELSAGQAQRVALARALAPGPSLLIADEALSALDVSLQAQMANLLLDLRRSLGIACLFISHDLRLASCLCDRVAVLSRGALVETGAPASLLRDPRHPATRALAGAAH